MWYNKYAAKDCNLGATLGAILHCLEAAAVDNVVIVRFVDPFTHWTLLSSTLVLPDVS
jgi:hypothetical protein